MDSSPLDLLWIVVCATLVMIMQGGFLCLESGCTRTKNSINVAVKNLTDFGVSVVAYWAIGFGLMFGLSHAGLFGSNGYFFETENSSAADTAFFVFQAMFCGTSVTIVSGAVAERMSFKGYVVLALFTSLFLYPIYGHWAWGGARGGPLGWLSERGFIDFAGSTVVHSVGGWVSLAAVIVLGPRLGRFDESGKATTINGQSLPMALLGALILCFGWIGFNGGSGLAWGDAVPKIVVHTILGASSGMIVSMLVGHFLERYPDPRYAMNGLLAGLVAITANCHIVTTIEAALIGGVGALFMIAADRLIVRAKLDDVVGAFSVHAGAGIWGTLAVAFFGDVNAFQDGFTRWDQFLIQGEGILICAAFCFIPTYFFLLVIRHFVQLRVSPEQELVGLNASEHKVTTEHLDLLREMELQSRKFEPSRRVYVEPFTEIGQIAQKYNEVLDSLEETVARNELIVRDTKDGILTCTQDGGILSVNPGAESMFGYRADELESRKIWGIVSTASDVGFNSFPDLLDHASVSHTRLENMKLVGVRKSGDRFPIELEGAIGSVGGQEVFTVKIRDRSTAESYQQTLREAKEEAVKARDELRDKVREIETFNTIAIDRETRMVELKEEINQLCEELGREPPFLVSYSESNRD